MKQKSILFLVLLMPVTLLAQPNTWHAASSSGLVARSKFASAVVNGKIYVIGGWDGRDFSGIGELDVYDPASDTWSSPTTTGTFTPRFDLAAAVVNGLIYVMGGVNNNGTLGTLEVFDPSTNTWSTPKTTGSMYARSACGAAVVDGKIYVIGGTYNADMRTVDEFDPSTNTWTLLPTPSAFVPRDQLATAVINNKIYAIGGWETGTPLDTVQIYDPSTNVWSAVQTTGTFTPRNALASAVVNGKIYVMGGQNATLPFLDSLEVFDPSTNSWSTPQTTDTMTARHGLSAQAVNGIIYAIGGIDQKGILSLNEAFTPESSGVAPPAQTSEVEISPNPTEGIIVMHGTGGADASVTVANTLGQKVMSLKHLPGPDCTLDVSTLPPGAYYITIASSTQTVTKLAVRE